MEMTPEQFNTLLDAIKSNSKSDSSKMLDNVWKVASTIGLALILWIFQTTQSLDKRTAVMEQGMLNNTKGLQEIQAKVDTFTEKPRFTQEDFNNQISPIISSIQGLSNEIKGIEDREKTNDTRIQSIELQLSLMQQRIK